MKRMVSLMNEKNGFVIFYGRLFFVICPGLLSDSDYMGYAIYMVYFF